MLPQFVIQTLIAILRIGHNLQFYSSRENLIGTALSASNSNDVYMLKLRLTPYDASYNGLIPKDTSCDANRWRSLGLNDWFWFSTWSLVFLCFGRVYFPRYLYIVDCNPLNFCPVVCSVPHLLIALPFREWCCKECNNKKVIISMQNRPLAYRFEPYFMTSKVIDDHCQSV